MFSASIKMPLRAALAAPLVGMALLPAGSFLCVSPGAHVVFLVAGCSPPPIDLPGHADEGLPEPPGHSRDQNNADGCHDLRVGALQTFERGSAANLPSPDLYLGFVPIPLITFDGGTTSLPAVSPYEANGPPERGRPFRVPLRI